jgi:hypothetical protein
MSGPQIIRARPSTTGRGFFDVTENRRARTQILGLTAVNGKDVLPMNRRIAHATQIAALILVLVAVPMAFGAKAAEEGAERAEPSASTPLSSTTRTAMAS